MATVTVHNITDRPNVESFAHAVKVGGQTVRPGKFVEVDSSLLSEKLLKLHGDVLWFGDQVPAKFKATSKAALRALAADTSAMTLEEVRGYLSSLQKEELLDLCGRMSPALHFSKEPSTRMLVVKLSRALFSDDRILDPSSFFWLRRWAKKGNVFVERA